MTENILTVSIPTSGAFGVHDRQGFRVWLMAMKEADVTIEDIDKTIVAITSNNGANFLMWDMKGAKGYER